MKNKRNLMISVFAILILIVVVIGVSFAIFSFSGTGTKENVITTGVVSLNFDDVEGSTVSKTINVDNEYPMDDTNGVNIDNVKAKADFTVKADYNANMTVNYEIGITDINENIADEMEQISSNYVKVILFDGSGKILLGDAVGSNFSGVTVDSLKSVAGPNGLINNYYLASGSFTNINKSEKYTMYAYLDKEYELPVDSTQTTTDNGGTVSRNNDDATSKSKKTTKRAEFNFKLFIKAAQV